MVLAKLARLDTTTQEYADLAETLNVQSAELSHSIRAYRDGLEFDPRRLNEIEERLASLDFLSDPEAYRRQEQLRAMHIAAGAIIRFAERHAEKARELALQEEDPQRRAELERIAEVCTRVPAHAPRDFWEAIQALSLLPI